MSLNCLVSIFFRFLRKALDRLLKIPDQIINILDSDADAHQIIKYTARFLFFLRAVYTDGRFRMDDKCFGIADIRYLKRIF